jgi:ADP-heptose:LPS heptosyltransferase
MGYLQTAWGESFDDVTIDDVRTAITKIQEMDEEHSAFWVGMGDEENILEVSKDLNIIVVLAKDREKQLKTQFKSWKEIEALYESFLMERYDLVKKAIG